MAKSKSLSKTAVWILLALLILGLAGFGATNIGGNIRSIGTVGDKSISTQSYLVAVQNEMRALEQNVGAPVNFAMFRDSGMDRALLQRLIVTRALDHEATELGLSLGDENVRDQVLRYSQFQGIDGTFNREIYADSLRRMGMSEGEFETAIREESARVFLQTAVENGVKMPSPLVDTLMGYIGEQRSFVWTVVSPDALETPPAEASDAELRAFYDENADQFTLPVTKKITYAWLSPEMVVDDSDVDEAKLREAYNARLSEYSQPERRLVERLVFADDEAATQAAASLEVSGTTFEALVQERGLTLDDVDLGDVDRLGLDAAGEGVFAAEVGDVVGPLPSDLGPALFRINGVLPAQTVTFEEAMPELKEAEQLAQSRRFIESQAESYEDILAGGATLEELVDETEMVLATIDWTEESGDDIAAYEAFRRTAAAVTMDDFPTTIVLDDGGVFALRLDEELPVRPMPYDQAQDDVKAAIDADRLEAALKDKAEGLAEQIKGGADLAELGLIVIEEDGRTRGAFMPGTPAEFLQTVFEMGINDVNVIAGNGLVTIVKLTSIDEPEDNAEAQTLAQSLQAQVDGALSQELFAIYSTDVALRAEARIDQRAVDAVNANLP